MLFWGSIRGVGLRIIRETSSRVGGILKMIAIVLRIIGGALRIVCVI